MLVTRGLGPGATLSVFGFGPAAGIAAVVEEIVRELVAAFIGLAPALQSPVQLAAMEALGAMLEPNLTMLEALVQSGLIDDTVAVEEALKASVDIDAALQSQDGSPEVG
jgi:hypothetical protein